MKPKASTGFTRGLLMAAATVIGLAPAAFAQTPQTFFVLNNPNDPMFNQLLGINNGNVIVGYFGDGMAIANHGYVLVPPNHYSDENFTAVAGCTTRQRLPVPPRPRKSGSTRTRAWAARRLSPISSAFTPIRPVLHTASWPLLAFNQQSMTP
jgi:hypothetical protein